MTVGPLDVRVNVFIHGVVLQQVAGPEVRATIMWTLILSYIRAALPAPTCMGSSGGTASARMNSDTVPLLRLVPNTAPMMRQSISAPPE